MRPLSRLPLSLLIAVCSAVPAWAQSDFAVSTLDRLRASGGACAVDGPPLLARSALDAVAASAARGIALEAALRSASYRATQGQVISITGTGIRANLQRTLAARFCSQIKNKDLTEVGVFEGPRALWIVLAAPFAPKLALAPEQLEQRMLALVNAARVTPRLCGNKPYPAAGPVAWNATLASAAATHARDMATHDFFSHTGHDGSTPAQRVSRAGYRWRATGENIAAGQSTPEAAVAGWIKSPPHCENLMEGRFTEMGVAAAANAASRMGLYWVQEFGAPR
ncbi:MAG: CAP domain-containing protein [Burkholderiaceae bacterium]